MRWRLLSIGTACWLLLLFSCSGSGKQDEEKTIKKQAETTQKEQKTISEPLTDKTVVAELTKFAQENPETLVLIKTSLGNIKVRLYKETPLHRANFLKLAKSGYFQDTEFFRVVKEFVVQGGDTDGMPQARKKRALGKYTIPAEFVRGYIHKKGALAAPRLYENNPEKRSSPYEFYLVQGLKFNQPMLNQLAMENKVTFTPQQIQAYTTIGGTPHLDGEHTVYGEVVEGIEVIDKIAAVEVGEGDWPLEYNKVTMSVEILE